MLYFIFILLIYAHKEGFPLRKSLETTKGVIIITLESIYFIDPQISWINKGKISSPVCRHTFFLYVLSLLN